MKFILTPIDFSAGTSRVVHEAAKLAATLGAQIILLHVVQVPKSLSAAAEFGGHAELVAAMESAAECKLLEVKASLLQSGINAHSLRLTGTAATDIVDQAEKLDASVPAAVPGIVFLSGGQSDVRATEHLDALNRIDRAPWQMSFSHGRALQAPALKAWAGQEQNAAAAQAALRHRARCNSPARFGQYTPDMEARAT